MPPLHSCIDISKGFESVLSSLGGRIAVLDVCTILTMRTLAIANIHDTVSIYILVDFL
jgi:hypothetical protein